MRASRIRSEYLDKNLDHPERMRLSRSRPPFPDSALGRESFVPAADPLVWPPPRLGPEMEYCAGGRERMR
jgi:hypothetical protein